MYNTVLCMYVFFSDIVYFGQIDNICTKKEPKLEWLCNSSTELSIGKFEKAGFKNERLLFRGHD
jgi:hypothetical protein